MINQQREDRFLEFYYSWIVSLIINQATTPLSFRRMPESSNSLIPLDLGIRRDDAVLQKRVFMDRH